MPARFCNGVCIPPGEYAKDRQLSLSILQKYLTSCAGNYGVRDEAQ